MTSTCSAAATALPAPMTAFGPPLPRRGFLGRLATLPLIGGGITLLGRPTGVAEPVTLDLMPAYQTWLDFEHKALSWEMANHPEVFARYGGRKGVDDAFMNLTSAMGDRPLAQVNEASDP